MSLVPKSIVNPLDDLYDLISKGTIQKTVEHKGKVFVFRSLFDEDYTWRDQFVNMNGPMVMLSSQRSPTLAIATVSIDGIPVEEIPGLDSVEGVPLGAKDFVVANSKYLIAYNLHNKVYQKLPRDYLEELYDKFLTEVELPSRIVEEKDLKNS